MLPSCDQLRSAPWCQNKKISLLSKHAISTQSKLAPKPESTAGELTVDFGVSGTTVFGVTATVDLGVVGTTAFGVTGTTAYGVDGSAAALGVAGTAGAFGLGGSAF